jgi:hypothetical protein
MPVQASPASIIGLSAHPLERLVSFQQTSSSLLRYISELTSAQLLQRLQLTLLVVRAASGAGH